MKITTSWPAPAKLNLLLRIVGRRRDGYHELQTVFQFLDLGDELSFQPNEQGKLVRQNPLPGVPEEADLTLRAARLLQSFTGTHKGAEITLVKKLPMGGGLGGGSSDAATTLLALNRIWGTGLDREQLAELGVRLGADVPVFVLGQAAWGEGIGETLTPLTLPTPWYLVIHPPCQVSTAEVFRNSDLTRDSDRITIRDFLAGQHINDCQKVVVDKYPEVRKALNWLNNHAEARLTGTGACVFAAFDSQQAAKEILGTLPFGFTGYVAKGLNHSPVNDLLD